MVGVEGEGVGDEGEPQGEPPGEEGGPAVAAQVQSCGPHGHGGSYRCACEGR